MRGRARSSIKSDQAKNVSWSGVSKSCWADIAATPQPIGRLDPAVIHVQATDANVNHNSTTHDGESTFESLVSIHESSLENKSNRRLRDRLKTTLHSEMVLPAPTDGREAASWMSADARLPLVSDYAEGYPRVAALENSDPNFLILRKFGDLHVRVLLHHQDELVELEDELDRLDCFDYEGDYQKLKSRRRDDAISPDHQKLLLEIEKKLAVYDELLLRYQQIHAIKRPTKRNQSSLYNFIRNTRSFVQSEGVWIERGEDLAALAHDEEHGWLASALEDALFKTSRSITQHSVRKLAPSPSTFSPTNG
ncbi:hypothetical protein MMC13_005011 [Lambiella insularis]|nr:hypothetical protein [Lambiella insularis]